MTTNDLAKRIPNDDPAKEIVLLGQCFAELQALKQELSKLTESIQEPMEV